jgi:hypothetical protein
MNKCNNPSPSSPPGGFLHIAGQLSDRSGPEFPPSFLRLECPGLGPHVRTGSTGSQARRPHICHQFPQAMGLAPNPCLPRSVLPFARTFQSSVQSSILRYPCPGSSPCRLPCDPGPGPPSSASTVRPPSPSATSTRQQAFDRPPHSLDRRAWLSADPRTSTRLL